MTTETIDKLFLELSQVTTAKTKREIELEALLSSARCIAQRKGEETHWERFDDSIAKFNISSITARTYKILPSDNEND
jgi:hypothetical protein